MYSFVSIKTKLLYLYVTLIIFITAGSCLAQKSGLQLTLSESIQLAIKNDPELKAFLATLKSAQFQYTATKKALGYRTDLTLGLTRTADNATRLSSLVLKQTLPTGGNVRLFGDLNQTNPLRRSVPIRTINMDYGVSFEQTVFTPNLQRLEEKNSDLIRKYQQFSYENQKRNLIFSVTNAFYNVVAAEKNVEVRRKAVQLAKVLVELVKGHFEKGVSVNIDLLESEVQLSLTEVNLRRAELELEKAKIEFLDLLGLDPSTEFSIIYKLTPSRINFPPQQIIARSIRAHPRVQALDTQVAQKDLEITKAKLQFDFNVSLVANYSKQATAPSLRSAFRDLRDDWSVSLQVNLPIWDSGITQRLILSALEEKRAAIARRESEVKKITKEVNKEKRALKILWESIELFKASVQYAEKNLALSNRKFAMGLSRAEDVIRAQQNLTYAQLNTINEMINYQLSVARLYQLTGLEVFAPQ